MRREAPTRGNAGAIGAFVSLGDWRLFHNVDCEGSFPCRARLGWPSCHCASRPCRPRSCSLRACAGAYRRRASGHGIPAVPQPQRVFPGAAGMLRSSHTQPQSSQCVQVVMPPPVDGHREHACPSRGYRSRRRRSSATVRWRAQAGIPHSIFPRRPVALAAPGLKVGFCPGRQEGLPCGFKGSPGFIKGLCGSATAFARIGPGIEAAAPSPLIDIVRHALTPRDRAHADVAIEDARAVLATRRTAACERRHLP